MKSQTKQPSAPRDGKLPSVPLRLYFEEWLRNMPVVDRATTVTIKAEITLTVAQWHNLAGFCLNQSATLNAALSAALMSDGANNFFYEAKDFEGVTGTAEKAGLR